ncbi:MAG: family 10 glycosylhydrolase [Lentisphaerota bacterium]
MFRACVIFFILVLCCMRAGSAEFILESFYYPTQAAVEQAWQAGPGAPAAKQHANGVRFPSPFRPSTKRFSWDKTASLNLAPYSSFEMELSCDNPEAIRSLALYFKSGEGWYIWNKPLRRTGRQTITMLKGDFQEEGKPAGWNRIEAIRFAPWKNLDADASLVLHTLIARSDSLLVIKGTLSAQDAVARAVSAKTTQRVSEWLGAMGINHGVIHDEDVEKGALNRVRLAILPYNPYPTAREMQALRNYLSKGGKLIVFYGANPELAALMHLKLGPYLRAERRGSWSSFSFLNPQTWQVPHRIFQDSPNLVPVYPADNTAETIAWWEDVEGHRIDLPAWVASEQGLWMSHILMNDDMQNKSDMLLGLLAHYDPTLWPPAARRSLERAGRIDSFRSFDDAATSLSYHAENADSPASVRRLIIQSRRLFEEMQALYRSGLFPKVVEQGRALSDRLMEAYSLIQKPAPNEMRGVWDHEGTGWFPGNWDKTCSILSENGINAIFANLVWGGLAHYPSRVLPQSATFRLYGDQLAQCLQSAHRRRMQVHVWKVCWNLSNAPADFVEDMKKQGRLQMNASGKTVPWLNPCHPENIQMALNSLCEVAQNYPVDGIHLDYIRYPDARHDFSPVTRKAFESHLGHRISNWPDAAMNGGALSEKFKRWKADQITYFVKLVHDRIKAINPKIKISAAVYGQYPGCLNGVGQDWADWVRRGYVDFVCPMNYTTDSTEFAVMTRKQVGYTGRQNAIMPGIGVTADESQLSPDQVIEQILALRRLGCKGFVLFDLSGSLLRETLPAMGKGITKP